MQQRMWGCSSISEVFSSFHCHKASDVGYKLKLEVCSTTSVLTSCNKDVQRLRKLSRHNEKNMAGALPNAVPVYISFSTKCFSIWTLLWQLPKSNSKWTLNHVSNIKKSCKADSLCACESRYFQNSVAQKLNLCSFTFQEQKNHLKYSLM